VGWWEASERSEGAWGWSGLKLGKMGRKFL